MAAYGMVTTAQFRLANYYLTKLRVVEATYKHGHEHSIEALALLDQEWSQIKRWRDWSAEHVNDHDDIAVLCMEYPHVGSELFLLRLHPHERLDWLEAGLAAARRLGDAHAEMVHQLHLGKTHSYLGSVATALNHIELALALARQLSNQLLLCKSLIAQGGIYYGLDEYEKSKQSHEQALAIGIDLEANPEIGAALNGLGNVAFSQSDYTRAHDYYLRFMEISEEIGSSTGVCMALRNLSMVTKRMGALDTAMAYAERAVKLCREFGYQSCLAESLAELGGLTSDQYQLTEAKNYYQQSLDLSRVISHRTNEAFVLYRLGCLLFRQGDVPTSKECLQTAASLSQEIGERWFAALAVMNLAELCRVTGNFQQACAQLQQGWKIAAAIDSSAIRAKYLVHAALLHEDRDYLERAAMWIGLLNQHIEKLRAEELRRFIDLCARMQSKLSQTQYITATEYGKTLDLNAAVLQAMNEVELFANHPLAAQPHRSAALDHANYAVYESCW